MERDDEPKTGGWRSIYGNERNQDGEREARAADAADARPERPRPAGGVPGEAAAAAEAQARPAAGRSAPSSDGIPIREGRSARRAAQPAAEQQTQAQAQSQPTAYVRRRKPRVLLWSFLIALGLVLSAVGGAYYYVWNGLRPPKAAAEPIRITIDKGMRAQRVAELLEQNGLIRDAKLFGGWMKLTGEGSRFQAGVYELTPGMTREEIVAKLNNGEIVAAATTKFTIPEGFTIQQIADRLAQTGVVAKDAFLKAAADPSQWSGSEWTSQIPNEAKLRFPLEGYLFPETYEVRTESKPADIIARMLSELDKRLDQLPEDWQTTLDEQGLTVHQLLTIASLVEREVVVDEERPIVAGIIRNRLAKEMPLQIDATIQYLLDKQKERLLEEDLKVDSPYNTYLYPGLPPGPIAAPSLKSIEAALYPEETDYLYYVTKKDGSNTHLFAVTFKQHQRNITQSNKNADKNAAKK